MRVRLIGGAGTLALVALSCSDIDTTRNLPTRGTIGEEVYGIFCDRIGAQSLPEDLTGASFRNICHKRNGKYADTVDTTLLPPISADAKDELGRPVSVEKQAQDRARSVSRVEALAKHRADLIAAIDATIPDINVAIKDTGNSDPKKTCAGKGEAKLGRQLADMLGRFTSLYNDGTIPASTRSLAHVMTAFRTQTEAQAALARLATRKGYRPVATSLGAIRPILGYPRLRDLANATLGVLSRDADPYSDVLSNRPHVPTPGAGYGKLTQMLEASRQEMLAVQPDPPLVPLVAAPDPLTGRTVISRPRDDIEMLQLVLNAQDPAYGGGNSRYIVLRDARGVAAPNRPGGVLPAPFVDKDKDGLADIDEFGQFVTSDGKPPPSPFFDVSAADTPYRDTYGRALTGMGGQPLYQTIDTTHTFAASLLKDMRPLLNPDPMANHESLMYALGGLYVIAGTRDNAPLTQRSYSTGGSITYDAYHPENSPLVDLVYAIGQLIGDPSIDDAVAYQAMLMRNHTSDVARVVGAGLDFKDIANKHPEAAIPAKSTLWDEIISTAVKIEKVPGLLEDVLRALGVDDSARQGEVLSKFMQFRDHISYDRNNLNGPPFNMTTNTADEMKTPVDRTKPLNGWNRSAFHRFLQLVHDGRDVTVCNKEGAIIHAKGVPILGSGDICAGALALCGAPGTRPFHECEVFKIENVTKFYIQAIVGKASLYFRPSVLRNGILGIGAATVDMIQQSSGIIGFWDPPSAKTFRPKPQWLNRLVFFDQANDSVSGGPNYTTNRFLRDLQGPHVGSLACPERVIQDPDPGAADASPDGKVHGLRSCSDGDWLDQRDQDGVFVLEDFGAYRALAPLIQAFVNHNQEDLFIELMETIWRHWPDDKDSMCNKSGDPKSNGRYCTQEGAVSYEPLLSEALAGDIVPAMNALTKTMQATTIPSCIASNAQTHQCTSVVQKDGIVINADAVRALIDPDRAKNAGIVDRKNNANAIWNDGTISGQITPIYLLTGALAGIDNAFAAWAQAHPTDNQRQAQWRLARSQLVDQFLGVTGMGASAQFKNAALPKITPVLVDMLRAQAWARCPDTFGTQAPKRCAWARDDLANKMADTIKGPLFSTGMDLADVIRADPAARHELEALLQYLVDVASSNDAFASMLASTADILQVLRDDKNLVPLFHVLAEAFAPSKFDQFDVVSMVDAQTSLLSRISGRAFDTSKTEICSLELDPNQILTQVLTRLVTPMKDAMGRETQTPLEVFMDAIADLNRIDPQRTDRLDASDYGAVTGAVTDFLIDKQRGLEQFYEIIRQGTQ